MKKIGFSHGVLYRVADVYSCQVIDIYRDCSNEAIETCINKENDVTKLERIAQCVMGFSYKSIHLPTDVSYKKDDKTFQLLDKIVNYYKDIDASLVLVHPDLVDDWEVFDKYKINWAIENMDNRKGKYKSVEELEEFFGKKPSWKLVLDLNHCYSNDKTMKLAAEIISRLKSKIIQIHLSGYAGYHEPLFQTKQDFILDYCNKLDVPVIIESTFDDVDNVKKEYNYITENLK